MSPDRKPGIDSTPSTNEGEVSNEQQDLTREIYGQIGRRPITSFFGHSHKPSIFNHGIEKRERGNVHRQIPEGTEPVTPDPYLNPFKYNLEGIIKNREEIIRKFSTNENVPVEKILPIEKREETIIIPPDRIPNNEVARAVEAARDDLLRKYGLVLPLVWFVSSENDKVPGDK